jgi:hypothetical protein
MCRRFHYIGHGVFFNIFKTKEEHKYRMFHYNCYGQFLPFLKAF